MSIIRDFFSPQFIRFLVAGGIAACVNFSVGYSLSDYFQHNLDLVAGHLSGMVVAFFLFEQKVFGRSDGSRLREVVIFSLVNLLAIIQTWFFFWMLAGHVLPAISFTLYPEIFARLCAIGVPVFTSFIGHKYFTFKHA